MPKRNALHLSEEWTHAAQCLAASSPSSVSSLSPAGSSTGSSPSAAGIAPTKVVSLTRASALPRGKRPEFVRDEALPEIESLLPWYDDCASLTACEKLMLQLFAISIDDDTVVRTLFGSDGSDGDDMLPCFMLIEYDYLDHEFGDGARRRSLHIVTDLAEAREWDSQLLSLDSVDARIRRAYVCDMTEWPEDVETLMSRSMRAPSHWITEWETLCFEVGDDAEWCDRGRAYALYKAGISVGDIKWAPESEREQNSVSSGKHPRRRAQQRCDATGTVVASSTVTAKLQVNEDF
jgi:hypothetical protein